jgi:hypothetical protein
MSRLRVGIIALLVGGCGTPRSAIHQVIVCDRSSSALCEEDTVREAARAFLLSAPPKGSKFEVLVVGCGAGDVAPAYSISVPASWGRAVTRKKREWRQAEAERLETLTLPVIGRCSAISAAIWRAARALDESPSQEQHLVVISDLREVNREFSVNFEKRILPRDQFVERLKSARLLPDLTKVHVTVCGVHDRATPDAPAWTARRAEQLRDSWKAAFSAMGVSNARLTERCEFGAKRRDAYAQGER